MLRNVIVSVVDAHARGAVFAIVTGKVTVAELFAFTITLVLYAPSVKYDALQAGVLLMTSALRVCTVIGVSSLLVIVMTIGTLAPGYNPDAEPVTL